MPDTTFSIQSAAAVTGTYVSVIRNAALFSDIAGSFAIVTTALGDGLVGGAYLADIAASGGTPGYTFAVTSGVLPPGLTLTSGTPAGLLAGVPSAAGTYTFTVTATDALGETDSRAYTIVIGAPCSGAIISRGPTSGGVVRGFYAAAGLDFGPTSHVVRWPNANWTVVGGRVIEGVLDLGDAGTATPTWSGGMLAGGVDVTFFRTGSVRVGGLTVPVTGAVRIIRYDTAVWINGQRFATDLDPTFRFIGGRVGSVFLRSVVIVDDVPAETRIAGNHVTFVVPPTTVDRAGERVLRLADMSYMFEGPFFYDPVSGTPWTSGVLGEAVIDNGALRSRS